MTGAAAGAFSFWKRALWMRLGALNGLVSLAILLLADHPVFRPGSAGAIHLGAQVQFMHGMATIACATFMNIGAKGARLAPAFFLSGVLLFSVPIYAEAAGLFGAPVAARWLGLAAFAVGWLIMAWAAKDIDRESRRVPSPLQGRGLGRGDGAASQIIGPREIYAL